MFTRRSVLAAAAGLGFISSRSRAAGDKKAAARVAHVTDSHVMVNRNAPKGMAALFAHMAAECKPSLVLHTGDVVMAVNGKVGGENAAEQIGVWQTAAKLSPAELKYCLGNHDVWDGHEPTAAVPVEKKGFALMTGVLGLPAPYYSFDHAGWHVVALNSVALWPKMGELGDEQFAWLAAD